MFCANFKLFELDDVRLLLDTCDEDLFAFCDVAAPAGDALLADLFIWRCALPEVCRLGGGASAGAEYDLLAFGGDVIDRTLFGGVRSACIR